MQIYTEREEKSRQFQKKIYAGKGDLRRLQTLTQCQKSFLFLQQLTAAADRQHKSCVDYAQIMPRLCTNHAKIMHKSWVWSTLCYICTLTDENESMQSLSITVISFSLSINKGDVPRVYVPQTVFWKRQI